MKPRSTFVILFGLLTLALGDLCGCGDDLAQTTAGRIGVSREELQFPQVQVGRGFNLQFAIRNNGDGDLVIQNIEIVGSTPFIQFSSSFMTQMALDNDWRQSATGQGWEQNPGFVMEAQTEIQVDIVFQPEDTDVGCDPTACGNVVITSSDRQRGTVRLPIELNQSSGLIEVDPSVVRFPDVVGGPFDGSFEVRNVGAGPLTVRSVSDPGVEGITLAETSNRQEPYDLDVGENSEYRVVFSPQAGVTYCTGDISQGCTIGTVLIDSNDAEGTQVAVTLQVGGVSVPDISVSDSDLEFDAAVGSPDTQTVDVSNDGGANLNWNLRISPTSLQDLFAIEVAGLAISASGQQMDPLAPGNRATVEITLSPEDEEPVVAELVITAINDPDEQITSVGLFNGAPQAGIRVAPVSLLFPEVNRGDSADLQFVIESKGRATLDIASATIAESSEFFLAPDLAGASVGTGERLPVTVTYSRPEGDLEVLDRGILSIDSNAFEGTVTVELLAFHDTGQLPPTADIEVSPDQGTHSVGQVITLDASGSTANSGELAPNPYSWALIDAPSGSTAELSSDFEVTTTLTPDLAGTYTVLLTVTAASGATSNIQGQATHNLLVE